MNWLGFALLSFFVFIGYELLSRKLGVNSRNPRAFSVVYSAISCLLTPILIFVEPIRVAPMEIGIVFLAAIGLTVWILFGRFEYFAHKHVEASTLAILLQLAPVFNFVLALIFLDEAITLSKLIGLALIIVANILVTGGSLKKAFSQGEGTKYALLIAFLLGVGWLFDKLLVPYFGVVIFTLLSYGPSAIFNALIPPISKKELLHELRTGSWKLIILGLFTVVGYGAQLKALALGEASKVIPIISSKVVFVVLLGAIVLGERSNLFKKFTAAILIVIAIYFMR